MDAISFVLGIKSSHLRSTHLRDLVYRGRILKTSKINADGTATDANGAEGDANGHTNGAEDEGAASDDEESQNTSQDNNPTTAWVMAVYEDDAGEEQHWKRTITNQGQSEYRINNKVVNAKQYNEALEAENILIKARNFLVFQGDVEAIASQSPKDLTRLVEQVSGSLEYQAEYDTLLKASEQATEEQATRLQQRRTINGEIKQYSEQKKEADNFARKQDERDEAIITHVLWKLYHLQRVIEESGDEIKKHQEELKEYRRGVEKHEQQLEEVKKEQAKIGREVGKYERGMKGIEREIEDKRNSLVPIDEKIAISNRNIDKYKKRVGEVSKERDSQSQSVDRLKKELVVVQKAQAKWEAEWTELSKKEGRQLSEADLQNYNRLKADLSKQTATAQIQIDNLTRQSKTDEETVKSLESKVNEHEQQLERLGAETADMTERKETIDKQIKQTSKDVDVKKKEYNALTTERLKANQKRTELEEKLQEVLRKLLEAESGRRQSEKEVRARETVVTMKRLFPGVRGRVHELCKPKQKKYETAVSTVLGRHFEAIVVDTEKTAKECITYLRENRLGQSTFVPLDTIQVKSVNSNLKGMHKNMRLAIDTIEYDSSVERAMSYACGDSMVCDDIATAKHLCYERNIEAKAVTLEGTVISKGGLITGGRGPNDRNARKWDDAELENLRRLKDKFQEDISTLSQGHKAITDEETLQGELTGLGQQLHYAREESSALAKNLESKKRELSHVQRQLNEVHPKYQEQSQSLENLQATIGDLQDDVSEVEDKVFAAFCKRLNYDNIREYEAQQGSLQQEGAQKKLGFTTQRSKLDNQLSFETQRLKVTSDRIKAIEESGERDSDLVESLEAEKEAMQAELDQLSLHLDQLEQNVGQSREKYAQKADKVSEQRRAMQKSQKDVDFVIKSVTGLEAEVQRKAAGRYALLRRCKIDEIKLPLVLGSASLESLPADDVLQVPADPDAMDVDEDLDTTTLVMPSVQDYGIEVDFSQVDDDLKEVRSKFPHNDYIFMLIASPRTNLRPKIQPFNQP